MAHDFSPDVPLFAQEAVISFELIMATMHKGQKEEMNRMNKGELFVLKHLHHQGRPATPSELSFALQSSMARISTILRSLEEKGHIERRMDLHDRRTVLVNLTAEGQERITGELSRMRNELATVFTAMGELDTKEFIRLSKIFSKTVKACLSTE